MISQRLQDRIIPHLKRIVTKDTERQFPWLFSRVYYTLEETGIAVNLRPLYDSDVGSFQFDLLTGTFNGVNNWEEIQRRGYSRLKDCEDAEKYNYRLL